VLHAVGSDADRFDSSWLERSAAFTPSQHTPSRDMCWKSPLDSASLLARTVPLATASPRKALRLSEPCFSCSFANRVAAVATDRLVSGHLIYPALHN
jgi:hypothetical protein